MANYGGLSVNADTTVTGDNVRVRRNPRTGETLYSAHKEDAVRVIEKETAPTDNYYWYMIHNYDQPDMKDGWIRGDYLAGSDAPNPDEGGQSPDIESDVWNQILNDEATLRKGSNNDVTAVKKLQQYLVNIGYGARNVGAISIDGIFGNITEKAVKYFQSECALDMDGIVGVNTATCLENAQDNPMFHIIDYYPLNASYMNYETYPYNEKSVIMRAISGEHGYPSNVTEGHQDARTGVAKVLMNRTNPSKHCNTAVAGDYSYKSVYLCSDYTSRNNTSACYLPRGCAEAMAQFSSLADDLLNGVWPDGAPLVSTNHIYQKGGSLYDPDTYTYSGFCRYPATGSQFSFFYINAYRIQ